MVPKCLRENDKMLACDVRDKNSSAAFSGCGNLKLAIILGEKTTKPVKTPLRGVQEHTHTAEEICCASLGILFFV